MSLSGVLKPMKNSQKCKPHLLVLVVGLIAPDKINRVQKSIQIQNNDVPNPGAIQTKVRPKKWNATIYTN